MKLKYVFDSRSNSSCCVVKQVRRLLCIVYIVVLGLMPVLALM